MPLSASWRAPPTIANLGPGFDVLGVAINSISEDLGDIVTATITEHFTGVRLTAIEPNSDNLPFEGNVAEVAARYVAEKAGFYGGIELRLQKRMRIGTGMGSSASSAVAAAMATNVALGNPYSTRHSVLLDAAIAGEAAAIKKRKGHGDNAVPAALGGFGLVDEQNGNFVARSIRHGFGNGPEKGLYFALIHPDVVVMTADARNALNNVPYDIGVLVEASRDMFRGNTLPDSVLPKRIAKPGGDEGAVIRYLRGFYGLLEAIREGDAGKLGECMMADGIITPVRAEFIPGYDDVKNAALSKGAYGFTISGSGPSVVSVTDDLSKAYRIVNAMQDAFQSLSIKSERYVCTVDKGAQPA